MTNNTATPPHHHAYGATDEQIVEKLNQATHGNGSWSASEKTGEYSISGPRVETAEGLGGRMAEYHKIISSAAAEAGVDPSKIELRDNLGQKGNAFAASPALATVSVIVPKDVARSEKFIDALALKNEALTQLWAEQKSYWEQSIRNPKASGIPQR